MPFRGVAFILFFPSFPSRKALPSSNINVAAVFCAVARFFAGCAAPLSGGKQCLRRYRDVVAAFT
jgi:hypothetical protein